jgi:hypothetical protein
MLCFLVISVIKAQGSIHGTITDSLTQNTLVGANIFLLEKAIGDATDLNADLFH